MPISFFFQALHPTYARSNVVHVKQGDEWIVDPTTIIDICVHYFKELINPQLLMTNEVSRARCRVATRVHVEGRDHGGLGLRSRGERIGHGMEA